MQAALADNQLHFEGDIVFDPAFEEFVLVDSLRQTTSCADISSAANRDRKPYALDVCRGGAHVTTITVPSLLEQPSMFLARQAVGHALAAAKGPSGEALLGPGDKWEFRSRAAGTQEPLRATPEGVWPAGPFARDWLWGDEPRILLVVDFQGLKVVLPSALVASGAAGGRGAADDDEDDPNHVTATPKSPLLAPVRRGSTAGAPGPELPFAQRSSSTGSAPRRQSLAGDSASPSVSGGAGVGVGPAVSASAGAGAGSTSE